MVRAAREARDWSQDTLSRRVKEETEVAIDQSGIARIEAGRRAVRLNEVVALMQVLGIDISQSTFASAPMFDDRTLANFEARYEEISRDAEVAHQTVVAQQTALDHARSDLARLEGKRRELQGQMIRIREYRKALDDLERSLDGDR